MKRLLLFATLGLCLAAAAFATSPTAYVDPRIGSEGLGRVYIGPCMPYGMAKPGPDAVSMPNSGWAPMPEAIKGFSQVHVSGTGGGQKYGNVLIMPTVGDMAAPWDIAALRCSEDIGLGLYRAMLQPGIGVEITSAHRAAIYRFSYPRDSEAGLVVDAGAFLGMSPVPDERETQQLVGSQIEVVSPTEIRGYNRVRGGWNNGRAYTVYFYAICDQPFAEALTWKGASLSSQPWQSDTHQPTGAVVKFARGADSATVKIGISYLSELKARDNLLAEIPGFDFDGVHQASLRAWDGLLSRIEIAPSASEEQKRMFYTGLYHTMLMPTERNGENPLWADDSPYYDDFYAIWDSYRTSSPMITLIDPARETEIVNSLLNIYKRDGYMPDARSGNSNGRTQGGSNAEIVIADAYAKGLGGIDYALALEAMLKDAEVAPGGNQEAEGRGGLAEYITLGYVPFGIDRAGNRTVEYAYCDYAIAQVAKGLGRDDVAGRYMRQSGNWRNLWRDDYEHAGVKGFIMPRTASGEWLDSLPQGHSEAYQPKYAYTAMTFEGPWYTPWWGMFFYEAPSWEYSLSIPHDVPGLIEACGGAEAFERRLDTFFEQGFYNVNNEPSFLSPCLYHWLGKPWRSSDRIREIIDANYSDTPMGLPGNDDSGAMSSWLAFHMLGLYPNAGQDYYLINTPLVEGATMHLAGGNSFAIATKGFSPGNKYIASATLNGKPYPYSTLRHADLAAGGTLELTLADMPGSWGREFAPEKPCRIDAPPAPEASLQLRADAGLEPKDMLFVFKLHAQTRRYRMTFEPLADGSLRLTWGIERNMKWQSGTYAMLPEALESADLLDLSMPIDGADVTLPADMTAYLVSRQAYRDLAEKGEMVCNRTRFSLLARADGLLHAKAADGAEIWILDNPALPIVYALQNNPLEVDWIAKP